MAPVLHWRDAMNSPQAQGNGVMARYEHHGREVAVPITPVSVQGAEQLAPGGYAALAESHRAKTRLVRRPPDLGEHNAELLEELGLLAAPSAAR